MSTADPELEALNAAILGVIVVEITIKLIAFGPRFFRSGWNVFDLVVVGIALVPSSGPLDILRSLRVLRVLRLVSQVKRLRDIVESVMRALPGLGWTAHLRLGLALLRQLHPDRELHGPQTCSS